MALQLVLNKDGNYEYQDPREIKPRPMISMSLKRMNLNKKLH